MKNSKDNKEAIEGISVFRLGKWFPDLSEDNLKIFARYNDELIRFNKALNLVSQKTLPMADLVHFGDSLMASRIIMGDSPKIGEIYDLGSGNGFPGLVFATLYRDVKVKLVDSDERKCEFLKHMSSALGLRCVEVICKNIESLPENSISYCMSRGFASISKSIYILRKIVKAGGAFYHLKSEEWSMEVGEIPSQLCSIWAPSLVGEYKLPLGEVKFSVVKTERIR